MLCEVCNGENFELHDGLYYCSLCNTQSQDNREEGAADFEAEVSQSSSNLKVRQGKKPKKAVQETESPWISIEAFNIVLVKQADSLINLGVSPTFKKTVLALWIKFLQKCEIAFKEVIRKDEPKLPSVVRYRDKAVLVHGKVKLHQKMKRKKIKIKHKKKRNAKGEKKSVVSEKDNFSVDSDFDWHSFASDSKASGTEGATSEEETTTKSPAPKAYRDIRTMYSSVAKRVREKHSINNKKQKKWICQLPDVMTLEKTLCFLYLGLIYHNSSVQLCDLIRWVRECYVPCLEASPLLPPSMRLYKIDNSYMKMKKLPTIDSVILLTIKTANLLNIDPSKLNSPPVMNLVVRFAGDMNLPHEVVSLVHHLLGQLDSETKKRPYFLPEPWSPPEIRAMAMIVVALKFLFGLDDELEVEASNFARTLMESSCNRENLFVWDEWEEHTKLKLLFIKQNHFPQPNLDAGDIINVQKISQFHQPSSTLPFPKPHYRSKCLNPDFKTKMKKTFSELYDVLSDIKAPATLYPLSGYLHYYLQVLSESSSTSLSPALINTLQKDFSRCSVSYLLESLEEDRKMCQVETGLNSSSSKAACTPYTRYWFIPVRNLKVQEWKPKYPQKFMWLMSVCSYVVEASSDFLCREISKIENVLFDRQ